MVDLGLSTGSLDSAELGLAQGEGQSPQLPLGREGLDGQNFEQAFLRPSVRSSDDLSTDPGASPPMRPSTSDHPPMHYPVMGGNGTFPQNEPDPRETQQAEPPFVPQPAVRPNPGHAQDIEAADLAAAINGPAKQLQVPQSNIPLARSDANLPYASGDLNAPTAKALAQQQQHTLAQQQQQHAQGQGPPLQQLQQSTTGRGTSVEQQALLDSWKNVRNGMWQAVDDVAPLVGNPTPQPFKQPGVLLCQPPAVYLPQVSTMPGPFVAQVTPLGEGTVGAEKSTVVAQERAETPPPPPVQRTASASSRPPAKQKAAPAAEEPPDEVHGSQPEQVVPAIGPGVRPFPAGIENLQRDFQYKLQTMRAQLVPELQARRQGLQGALQSTEYQIAEVRKRCAEAQQEGQADFEALKAHLSSIENLKLAVLNRERDERLRLVEGIDTILKRVDTAAMSCHNPDVLKRFVDEFPELHANAQSLWSRAAALPQVEVGLGDIPFEARAKSDKLRKFAVMSRLQQAKDVCLWRLEQQRRQFANEVLEAAAHVQHLESLLDRYADELAHVCYFCNERFSAGIANTRCLHNGSHLHRAGSPPTTDPRVPGHACGTGLHFWVPYSQNSTPRVPFDSQAAFDVPRMRLGMDDAYEVMSAHPGSRQSTPPRMFRDALFGGHTPPAPAMPWSAGFAPLGGHSNAASADALLRKIAQAFDRCGADVRSAFRQFDANGDGFISPQEFRQALLKLKIPVSDEEIAHLVSRMDTNADGMVSYEEFLVNHYRAAVDPRVAHVGEAFAEQVASQDVAAHSLWQRVARAFRDRGVPLRQVFALFDWDGDGIISWQEMLQAFRMMHLGLSESDIERLMRDIDVNEDGKVSIQEFTNRLMC